MPQDLDRTRIASPLGTLEIAADKQHIRSIRLVRGNPEQGAPTPLLRSCVQQLREYFAGTRTEFELPLSPEGTPFQKLAWYALTCIEHGTFASYGQVARAIGKESAVRAVGGACGSNPVLVVIPCHRVIASTGRLGGFSAGLSVKRWLLNHEARKSPRT